MKILILDDMKTRHDAFRRIYAEHEVVCVFRYSELKEKLAECRWDLIHLDHDLGDAVENPDTFVDGWGSTREFDGQFAAVRVCELPPEMRPGQVIVHSVNPEGAKRMLGLLQRAKIDVTWEPFGDVGA